MGDLRTAISSAGPSAGTQVPSDTSAILPGLLFSHEVQEVKRALAAHEHILAHLLDPEMLTSRFTPVEESVREILAQAQAPQSGPAAFSGAAPRPFGLEFGGSFA